MRPFDFVQPASLEEAAQLLSEAGSSAMPLAGGSDALGTLKDRIHPEAPELLVDLKAIPGMEYIREDDGGLVIGALTRIHAIEIDPAVRRNYPLLAEAARSVASPQLRNMGTLAGNLCQEPRCWYYRHPDNVFDCTRKGGRYCNALVGENRYHSVFGSARVGTRPCTLGCPGEVPIPEYMEMLRAGDLEAAARLLLSRNPLPAVTGRVCPHYCEQECNRGVYDEAVSVRGVERQLGDFALDDGAALGPQPQEESGKRVAVVGSGPAGLAAAFYLRQAGHTVTVYEKQPEAGGLLRYAIPEYRLPTEVVRRQVAVLEAAGVEVRCGVDVGGDVPLETLRAHHDAVFVATGAWGSPGLGLESEELLSPGLPFLQEVKDGLRAKPGQRVVVVGGGNVAVDVAIAAKRLGATQVAMVCLECEEEMPALSWELEQARAEGVELYTSWGPARILTDEGRLSGLELVRCTCVFDDQCSFDPKYDQGVRRTIDADRVFLAIGQRADLAAIDRDGRLRAGRSYIQADPASQETSIPGIFAGGDVATGPSTVISAVAAGRRAAAAIDRLLAGSTLDEPSATRLDGPSAPPSAATFDRCNTAFLTRVPRAAQTRASREERSIDREDAGGFDDEQLRLEANRCFDCGCVAVSPSDLATALLALDATIVTTGRVLAAADFFAAGVDSSTVLRPGELVREVRLPRPAPFGGQSFRKFRIRNAIDFPIVGVAAIIALEGGRIADARLALGAVAPIPIRAEHAEEYLRGKSLGEDVAEQAALLAVSESNPLAKNAYKLQITKALVKRAILEAGNPKEQHL